MIDLVIIFTIYTLQYLLRITTTLTPYRNIWAAAYQNQQNDMCAQWRPSEDSDQAQSDQSLRCPNEETLDP